MIVLLGIGSMTGKVTTAKDGSPMSVDLELVCPDGDVAAQYRTGKDGRFSLTDVVEGSYDLVVRLTATGQRKYRSLCTAPKR